MDTPQQTPPPVPNTTPITPAPAPYTPPPVKPAPVPFVPPPASSPPPVAIQPQGGSHTGLLLTIFVLILILAAAAYYFFYRTAGEPTESPTPSTSPSPLVEVTPTPSPSSMASVSWQVYSNEQYGFEISTPPSWASRMVTTTIPTGKTANVQIAYSPTAQLPAQGVEVFVYTTAQWAAELLLSEPHPVKIGQSTVYVYATPVRPASTGLPGESDVPEIITTFKLR